MHIVKKLFFILIFSLLFFIPEFSQAQALTQPGSCVNDPKRVNCASLPMYSCTGTCSWNYVKSSCETAVGSDCAGKDYFNCTVPYLLGICMWTGAIPTVTPATPAAVVVDEPKVETLPIIVPKISNPTEVLSVRSFIGNMINAAFGFVGSIALLMFIFGGLSWMMSAGNAEKVKKSRDTLVWAAIGLVFIFLSYAIARIVIKTLS